MGRMRERTQGHQERELPGGISLEWLHLGEGKTGGREDSASVGF